MKTKLFMIMATSLVALFGCSNSGTSSSDTTEKDLQVQESVEETVEEVSVPLTTEELNKSLSEQYQIDVTISEEIKTDDSNIEEVIEVMIENLQLAGEENLVEYMKTNVNEIAVIQENIDSTKALFDNYDIEYELLAIDIQELSDEHAIVTVTQQSVSTYVAEGYLYDDNIATATHTLKKEDGTYKFEATNLDNVEFIN
nr:hypothetical protein [Lysinibacillus timonensis]